MKKNILVLIIISFSMLAKAVVVTTTGTKVTITGATANCLTTALNQVTVPLNTVTSLSVGGTIDARDFATIKSILPNVSSIDLSVATIAKYSSTKPANTIPVLAFSDNTVLSNILLPNTVTNIGNGAFSGCTELTHIVFPSLLKYIESAAFAGSGLISIDIPSTVQSVGQDAFVDCPIETVTWNGSRAASDLSNSGFMYPYHFTTRSGIITIDENAEFSSLTLDAGAEIIVESGVSLTISGNLILHSDPFVGMASFYNKGSQGSLIVTGSTIVDLNLTSGRYWYLASPMNGCSLITTSGSNVYVWNETTQKYAIGASTASGQGYSIKPGLSGIIAYNGSSGTTLNFSDISKPLTYTAGKKNSGYSLVGNPFPSYLNWHDVYVNNTIDPTISYSVSGNFATYNASNGVCANNASPYIPPMQSIWVLTHANTTLNMRNSYCVSKALAPSFNLKADTVSDKQIVRLKVANGDYADEQVLVFSPSASNAFDDWDSRKNFAENVLFPQIYSKVDTEKVIINSMNSIGSVDFIPVYFSTKQEGTFTFSASENVGLDSYTVELKDLLLNTTSVLTKDQSYTFTSSAVSDVNRFEVRLKANATDIDEVEDKKTTVYCLNHDIVVQTLESINDKSKITVYNSLGQIIAESNVLGDKTIIPGNFTNGTYFVKVQTQNNVTTKSIEIL